MGYERELKLASVVTDFIALAEHKIEGRRDNWDGSTQGQITATIREGREALAWEKPKDDPNREPTQAECERMVRQEVLCCVSGLVSTLAEGYGAVPYQAKTRGVVDAGNMLASLCEKAQELAAPVDDWEEAAMQAGWSQNPTDPQYFHVGKGDEPRLTLKYDGWQALCSDHGIEPYQREVFEHWAVSQWLAEKLIEQGEKVDTDFEGLNVWARTCAGQAISLDGVIVRIVRETQYGMGHTRD